MGERNLTVREKIIVHLAGYIRFAEEFECPEAMCQAGISNAIGKSRAHTTLEVNRMKQDGLLNERLAHVKGARSKRKTYTLTPLALEVEKNISRHIKRIEVIIDGQPHSGEQAVEHLMGELQKSRPLAYDIIMTSNGRVDTRDIKPPGPDKESTMPAPAYNLMDNMEQPRTAGSKVLMANERSKRGEFQKALDILAECDDCPAVHSSRASILRKQGDLTSALREINLAIDGVPEGGVLPGARCRMEKAMILFSQGNGARALEMLDSAERDFQEEESQVDKLRCGINRAIVLRGMGNTGLARECLLESLELAEKTGIDRFRAYTMVNLCDILNEQGDYAKSAELAGQAAETFGVLGEPLMHSAALFNLGAAQAGLGNRDDALKSLDRSISILEKNDMLASRTPWLKRYSDLLREMGMEEKASEIMNKA